MEDVDTIHGPPALTVRCPIRVNQDHSLAWPLLVIEPPDVAPSPDHHGLVFPMWLRDCLRQPTHRELQVWSVLSVVEQGPLGAGVLLRLMRTEVVFAITDVRT